MAFTFITKQQKLELPYLPYHLAVAFAFTTNWQKPIGTYPLPNRKPPRPLPPFRFYSLLNMQK
ncbi:hypothetical protein [Prevotella intermedia]|uniref:hypothetical protein n=1 Tax=Prevotella intermedia TaxID=28131 RepID=UPI00117D4D94|nr:hypothetical protein [Prevotella intermedia]